MAQIRSRNWPCQLEELLIAGLLATKIMFTETFIKYVVHTSCTTLPWSSARKKSALPSLKRRGTIESRTLDIKASWTPLRKSLHLGPEAASRKMAASKNLQSPPGQCSRQVEASTELPADSVHLKSKSIARLTRTSKHLSLPARISPIKKAVHHLRRHTRGYSALPLTCPRCSERFTEDWHSDQKYPHCCCACHYQLP